MKVKLTLSNDTVMAVNSLLERIYDLPVSQDKRENVYKSIGFDLADKFSAKAKNIIRKADLFAQKKNTISLKYHEAWALEQILGDLTHHFPDKNNYRKMLIIKLTHTINQKLA